MAITISTQITGQEATSTFTYCYLYEPLKINVLEDDTSSKKIYIDLEVISISDGITVAFEPKYGSFDRNPSRALTINLMDIAQQYHDSNLFKISTIGDLTQAKDIVVSKYKYSFNIYSDITTTPVSVKKLPIIGGRMFRDFESIVPTSQVLTEAELYNVDLTGRWLDYYNITNSLTSATSTNAEPTITSSVETGGKKNCGGMLIWKSRFGGWMYWGMDIAVFKSSGSYGKSLQVGMMEGNDNGNPYVQVDYTERENSYSYNLKSLSLNSEELKAVQGIANSVAVYYMETPTSNLELMRLSSSTAPVSTLTNGGDFSVSLKSISVTNQKSR